MKAFQPTSTVFNIGWYEGSTTNLDFEDYLKHYIGPSNNWKEIEPPKNYERAFELFPGRKILVSETKRRIIIEITDEGCDALASERELTSIEDWIEVMSHLRILGIRLRRLDVQLDDYAGLIPFDDLFNAEIDDLLDSVVSDYRTAHTYKSKEGNTLYFGSIGESVGKRRKKGTRSGIRIYQRKPDNVTRLELQLAGATAELGLTRLIEHGSKAIPGLVISKIRFLDAPSRGRSKYDLPTASWFRELTNDEQPIMIGQFQGKRKKDEFDSSAQNLVRLKKSIRKLALNPEYGEKFLLMLARDRTIRLDSGTVDRLIELRNAYGIPTRGDDVMTTVPFSKSERKIPL